MLKILRQPNFLLLTLGQATSAVGDWLLLVALPFRVYQLTGSTVASAGTFVAETLPRLLFSSVGGVFADRWDRRRLMVALDVVRGLTVLALLTVRSPGNVWVVYLVASVESTASQFFVPARAAILPSILPRADLAAGNQLGAVVQSVAAIVGPPLGGALISVHTLGFLGVLDAATYAVSACSILLIRLESPGGEEGKIAAPEAGTVDEPPGRALGPAGQAEGAWRELVEGLRFVRGDPIARGLFEVFAMAMPAQGVVNVVIVPYVKDVLGASAAEYGWLMSAQAIGALAGGIAGGLFRKCVSPGRIIGAGLLVAAACFSGLALASGVLLPFALSVLLGAAVINVMVYAQTVLQLTVPDRYRGRVFGSFVTVVTGATLLGLGLGGALAQAVGIRRCLGLAASLFLAAGIQGMRRPGAAREDHLSQSSGGKAG